MASSFIYRGNVWLANKFTQEKKERDYILVERRPNT